MRPIYLIISLFIFPCAICNAQPYYFRHYQVEQGLSNNTVYCSLQDKQGFLWFGTRDGLNRFDGYTFRVFRHNPKNSKSICNNMVHALALDHDGNIWVGTDEGIDKFDSETESFSHINNSNKNGVRAITFDHYNNCWYVAGASLIKYNQKTRKIIDFYNQQHFDATGITQNNDGYLWASSAGGTIERMDTVYNRFKSYSVVNHSNWAPSTFIEKVFTASADKIFIATSSQGFKVFDCISGTYTDVLTYNPNKTGVYVRDFTKYSDNEFWIATESGIFIYDVVHGTFTNLKKKYNDPYSISDNAVYTLWRDVEGGIWAGTYFGGVNYYPKQYSTFNKFYPGDEKNSLKGNVVREICKDNYGNLWMGTEDNGLNKLSADKKTWTHYLPGGKNDISNTNIHGLIADGKNLFIGTFERGLDIMDIPSGKVVKVYLANKQSHLKSNFVICFRKTRNGSIYAGATRGFYVYNPAAKDFTIINKIPEWDFIYDIIEDHTGKLWIATVRDGIYTYDPQNNVSTHVLDTYPVKDALKGTTVNGAFEDSNHILWFATDGLGLWRYDPVNKKFKFFDLDNGMPSNYVFRMLEDDNKNLWISTSRGLVCFNIVTNAIKVYTKANGLLSDQFNYNSAFKDTDGTMYFGCVKGMVSFKPLTFSINNYVAPVFITGFQVYNQEILVKGADSLLNKSIIYTSKIYLNHNQSSFSIDFAALSYPSPEMTQYKYMMKGLDKGWTGLKRNRKVYFTQLQPGHYTFIVKAANNNGIWTSKETTLEIEIAPPFWESNLAYFIYLLLIAGVVYYLLREYHNRNRLKNNRLIEILESDKERQIYNAKIEFFTNVAHEIRTPLTLIKGPMEKVIKRSEHVPDIQNNLKIMEKNTNRLLDLTNQLLDFRRTETNGFSLNFVKSDIAELLADIFLRFKPMAEQRNQSYVLQMTDKCLYAYVDIEAFTKIVSNLINNAIKYGNSVVEIELQKSEPNDHTFTIEIRNNGYIVPYEMREKIFEPFFRMKESEKQIGTGIGLSLSRSLAELHKGLLVLNKSINNFNIFNLTLPIHQEKEFDLHSTPDDYEPIDTVKEENFDFMKPIILLVDDNPEILDFIADDLSDKYAIIKAFNGQEALDMIEIENIQLIISDVMMPGIDGFELCKRIKTNFDYSHIPIILLTAKNTLQSKIEGLEVGADAYIEKPFSPEHLQVQIANLLINRNKIKDHFASSPLANIKTMAYSKPDESFLDRLNAVINHNIQNPDLDVEHIANLMNMSKPTLYRKVKAISNLSINELINITRLKAAAKLLEDGDYKVYEVANMVGYSSQSHLGRNFLKQFGTTPTEYQQNKKNQKVKTY
ncbi:hybrid sensor histidine kinase/response regulator transcription factor [Mucilaginibacter dorajii]|nr:hybrid sensor histidine kinase/response regulator transcription factor [Mucilaginibacter dorajii]MCS3736669.1 signal transduction histidine kinase/ligand-binding sensor domain-containing protein/CheY-like chemotaxis protein/AraC-like DNA-binding protein [Mucilaginibacter dorajii]